MNSESEKTPQISLASFLASLSAEEQKTLIESLTPEQQADLKWNWDFWARPNQKAPEGDWNTWLVLAGRGFGKTRMGSEWLRQNICGDTPLAPPPSGWKRVALVAETAADARDVMVLGDSGILACHPKAFRPEWSPTNRRLTWPNGVQAWVYNATEPDQLRGPQHHAAWVDELAKFRYMQETWDQVQFGLRLGVHPQTLVTTTPRPLPLIKKMVNDSKVFVTRGATLDNAANLAKNTIEYLYDRYSGTRLGRQELEGEILGDIPGALWNHEMLDKARIKEAPELDRIVVAVDPAASSEEGSDENGIVACGMARDEDGYAKGYVLADRSLRGTPEEWARAAVKLYRELDADRIIAEKNNGGEMVESVIRSIDRNVPVTLVHATRGKHVRAEPISALYEQGRIHHVGTGFDKLEDQMCLFSIDTVRDSSRGSPDRVDALVWGLTELFEKITSRPRKNRNVDANGVSTTHPGYKTSGRSGKSDQMWMAV